MTTVQSSSRTSVSWLPSVTIGSTASARPAHQLGPAARAADVGHVGRQVHLRCRCRGRRSPRGCRSRPAPRTVVSTAWEMSLTRPPSRAAAMPAHSASSVTRISSATSGGDLADRDGDRGVAVPAVDDRAAVDRDHVAVGEHADAGDAVHDLVVDRGADGAGERRVAVALERRDAAVRADVVLGERVELAGGDTRPHRGAQQLEGLARPAGRRRASGRSARAS